MKPRVNQYPRDSHKKWLSQIKICGSQSDLIVIFQLCVQYLVLNWQAARTEKHLNLLEEGRHRGEAETFQA